MFADISPEFLPESPEFLPESLDFCQKVLIFSTDKTNEVLFNVL
jgi:hypothetical protein